jgi:hypothetical protein
MNIYGIIDLLAVVFVALADVDFAWLKWSVITLLLIKGLHSQLG